MKNKVMAIVKKICNTASTSCRGLNHSNLARELMNLANIPQNADIQEIPLSEDDQVIILFLLPNDKNYYSLFCGIGCDGKFYFELTITGTLQENGEFHFFDEDGKKDEILSIAYFVKRTMVTEQIMDFIRTVAKMAVAESPDLTTEQCIVEYISQIKEHDYYNVVNWANWKGIIIPDELRWVIDPEF